MTARQGAVFPGGPRRDGRGRGSFPQIRRVQEMTVTAERRRLRRTRNRRAVRLALGMVFAMLIAGVGGVLAGRELGPPARERARRVDAAASLDRAISREVNRTLLELWKMEDAERPGALRRSP